MSLCGYDEGGYLSLDKTTKPKARKQYTCGECERVIQPGETYRRDFQVYDGRGETNLMCSECDDLAQRFHKAAEGLDLTFFYGNLRSAIRDLYHEFDRVVEGHDYPPQVVAQTETALPTKEQG